MDIQLGAKIASNFRQNDVLTKVECERLLSFTNNSGPLFIIGTIGVSLFGSSTIGFLLFTTHILACLTVGFLFRFWKSYSKSKHISNAYYYEKNNKFNATKKPHSFSSPVNQNIKKGIQNKQVSLSNLGAIISESITSSFSTLVMIGGFVVLFSVIISIFNASHLIIVTSNFVAPIFDFLHIPQSFIAPLITGILEITNGISLIANIHIKEISLNITFTAFLLGFGGISVFLQVLSITSKTDLSIKPYIIGKILHGTFAAFYTFLIIQFIPIFNLNL